MLIPQHNCAEIREIDMYKGSIPPEFVDVLSGLGMSYPKTEGMQSEIRQTGLL